MITVNLSDFDRFEIFPQNEEYKLNTYGMVWNHTDRGREVLKEPHDELFMKF